MKKKTNKLFTIFESKNEGNKNILSNKTQKNSDENRVNSDSSGNKDIANLNTNYLLTNINEGSDININGKY